MVRGLIFVEDMSYQGVQGMQNVEEKIQEFQRALLSINRIKAAEVLREHYSRDQDFKQLETIINQSLQRIGDGWQEGIVSLSQVYMSGVLCEELFEDYLPRSQGERKDTPRIAVAVLKDQHSLGKKIVSSILKSNGYEIIDLGQGLEVEKLAQMALENRVEVLMISTLMLSSALEVAKVKELLQEKGAEVKIIVGGAPFRLNPHLWESVGADAQGTDASDILKVIESMGEDKDG